MRKTLLAALALIAAAGLSAEEAKSSYSITSDVTYTTRYFFRGVKNQDSALQPSVTYTQGAFSGGIWTSQALGNKDTSWAQGKEYDFFGGYTFSLENNASVTLGGTYYYYPSARPSLSEAKKSYEGSIAFAAPVGPLSGKFTVFHDFKFDSNTLQADLGYSVPMSNGSFDVGAYFGYNDIGDGDADLPGTAGYTYKYYGLDASVSIKLSDKATAKLGGHWTDTRGDLASPDKNLWVTLGVTVVF
ncbi:MAG: TorF family putative porin [Candidatus Didemnitutus sp.]|nr:TorF family putative porin [Candidatus Didemnitutus sp.]